MAAKPRKPVRTTVGERVTRVVDNARSNANGPADREDFGRAGRGLAYILTGDEQLVPGVPHHSRRPRN